MLRIICDPYGQGNLDLSKNTGYRVGMFGIGIDIEDAARFQHILKKPRLLRKIFTNAEIAYCKKFADFAPRFAARFAAKEAVFKALGAYQKKITLKDIEIVNGKNGAPLVRIKNKSLRATPLAFFLSISHTKAAAVAVACVCQKADY